MIPLPVRHQLIIRHPTRKAILLEADAGARRLPCFTSDDRHTAEVDYINAAVRARFGLVTTVLRSLGHDLDPHAGVTVRTHELEVHGSDALSRSGPRWYGSGVLASLPSEDAAAARGWLTAAHAPRVAVDGREWTMPGWFDAVCAWIERSLHDAGAGTVTEVVQLRAWSSSCVLLARTATGEFYCKAVPESLQRERALTAYLAQHFAAAVPRLVATHPERRWLLTQGFRGRKLEDICDVPAWERAAAMYARLQVACIPRTGELRALGCPERPLEALAAAIEGLATDPAVLRPGEADGLSAAETARLRALMPDLRQRCETLAAQAIPSTLEHGDLWPGNFLVDGAACVLIDWEDAAIGHPFFSLAPLLVGLATYQPALNSPDVRKRLEEAYLTAFTAAGTRAQLRAALELAKPLSFIDMALRYSRQPPSVVRLHPWMRDLVPQTLKLALARVD